MRIPRLYVAEIDATAKSLPLDSQASHYLGTVLRMTEGRELILFDGTGTEYTAIITHATKRNVAVRITGSAKIDRESPLITHLAIGLSKGDRMDLVIQKATELGVTQVTPIFAERSELKLKGERLEKKLSHWQQIAISACEQCQRNVLPVVHPPRDLADFVQQDSSEVKLVLHHRSDQNLQNRNHPRSVSLLIGPEGGLSEQEIAHSLNLGFTPLTLGPRVLRTETAPLTALTAVQLLWGDLAG